jgi:serine/threonine-protein kinase
MKKCPQCGKEYQDANTLCPADGTVLEKDGDELVGQTLANKYRVEELINEGGMGAVYRGTHVLMDKTVAIKVLHPALAADDKIVARFSREAKAASRISHPHALNVTDFGESDNGVVFLIMEYLRGKTLKEVIHEDGPMPLPRVIEIVRQVCGALEAAHGEGVVHRDLKSDNIMLLEVGGGDWAKVLDFGIAKITEKVGQDPALTAPNLIIGTPQYMSPEQCSQASEIDARSDIYSFGIILFEMLVGHVPFTGESPTAIMMKHIQDAPPSILEERKDLPAAVGRVVARALAKRPEDRFQTVSELSESLAQTAEDLPLVAATNTGASERDTNRIVVPTGSNEAPRDTANDDYDEATVVRPRTMTALDEPELFRDEIAPPPPESVNIWKIIIPAVAGLVVLFGVIYALTSRNSGPAPANDNTLTVDPGGQPVQPAQPVTGQGEQGINPNAPPVNATGGGTTPGTQPGTTPAQNGSELPATGNSNENRNTSEPKNDNSSGEPVEEPTPPPVRNNNGRNDPPTPQTSPTPDADADDPPPLPTPKPKPKATPPPAETVPKAPPGVGALPR